MFSMSQPKEAGVAANVNDGVFRNIVHIKDFPNSSKTSTCQRLLWYF